MRGVSCFLIIVVLSSSSLHAQLDSICAYFERSTPLVVHSDSIIYSTDSSKQFMMPSGWGGAMEFESLGDLHMNRVYDDTSYVMLAANEVWLVEFHDAYIQGKIDSSSENCSFLWNGHTFNVYQLPNEPIHIVYQIAREHRDTDGWTWIFRIYTDPTFTEQKLADLKFIVAQITALCDSDN